MILPLRLFLAASAAAIVLAAAPALAADNRTPVTRDADLPRFSYRVPVPASKFLESDTAAFAAFAAQVRRDVDGVLAAYRIDDRSTLAELLNAKLALQELAGEYKPALETIETLRGLEEKPAAKLLTGLVQRARIEAALATGSTTGAAYDKAFESRYRAAVAPLPWDVVREGLKGAYGYWQLASRAAMVAGVGTELDPAVATSGALNAPQAWELVSTRLALERALPLGPIRARVLREVIAKNETPKPDIWAAREVTLPDSDRLTPVNVAIWDSGIDVSLFPKQLFTDPQPGPSGDHGFALDDHGKPTTGWLHPLTEAERAAYPEFEDEIRGRLDLQNGIDSPLARSLQKTYATMSPEAMQQRFGFGKVLGHYVHGTHCAGIAVRGNPAARLVVARFNDQLPDLPFPPTEAWAEQMRTSFRQLGEYLRSRKVRVVNMSWGDYPQEFELWLSKTGGGADPQERKQRASRLFGIFREAVAGAIQAAPDTLFIAAAGNSDSNVGFIEDVPASLRLPNLIAVGAVDQAGDETSFTSHGDTVVAHANGYQVDSFVPGGARLPLSGTSMAAPNVVNLAAKLIALDPTLTPAKTIDLIRRGETRTADGRRQLIDPRRSVALLESGT